jgi:hypothetical protein
MPTKAKEKEIQTIIKEIQMIEICVFGMVICAVTLVVAVKLCEVEND